MHDLVDRLTARGVPFTPAESLTVEQALRAYTIGSAYAAGEERHKGTLSRGRPADFVVLGDDLLAVATVVVGAFVCDQAYPVRMKIGTLLPWQQCNGRRPAFASSATP
ncbi:amidohydrolase family protein [Microbispora bryophytorum]|uniref:amidohydrolase family protein n=1 Tax=Microbispora bryophytorum TaxID=1460882 RepID=UPI0033EE8BF2